MPIVAPIDAVILGIDPAKHTSGATILVPHREGGYSLAEFGKVLSQAERRRFVQRLVTLAQETGRPAVLVAEEWDGPHDRRVRLPSGEFVFVRDPKWNYTTILGMGEGWGKWSAEIEIADAALEREGSPHILVLRVTPNVWRDDLFSKRRAKDTEALKVTARRYFTGVFGYEAPDDVSEAGCISLWGTTAGVVAAALASQAPRTRMRKAS